jgi:hypothetical protein
MKLPINWTKRAEKLLLGKTIVKIEWMSTEETEGTGWYKRPICLQLDDRSWIFPVMDDEGNDGGVLNYYRGGKTDVFPVWGAGDEDGDT